MDREIEPLGLEGAVDSGKMKSDLKYRDVLTRTPGITSDYRTRLSRVAWPNGLRRLAEFEIGLAGVGGRGLGVGVACPRLTPNHSTVINSILLYYFDQMFTGCHLSPKVFTEIGVQNWSDCVTYLQNVHFVMKASQDLPRLPMLPSFPRGVSELG
jgi:hypothetical protein